MPKPLTRREAEWERNWVRHHRAHRIIFRFSRPNQFEITGDSMQFSMVFNQFVSVFGSPVDISLNPSKAVLSNQVYSSSDAAIFTVAPDPANPGGAIITGVKPGTATLLEKATATEPDGTTTEKIQGVATIVLSDVPPPPPPVAASIVFTFGVPTDQIIGEPKPAEPKARH